MNGPRPYRPTPGPPVPRRIEGWTRPRAGHTVRGPQERRPLIVATSAPTFPLSASFSFRAARRRGAPGRRRG